MLRLTTALVMAALAGCAGKTEKPRLPDHPISLRFWTLDGDVQTLGSLRGRIVVIHIFTTWSDLALLEVPRLSTLARLHSESVEVVGLAMDDDRLTVEIFAESFQVPYAVGRVDQRDHFMSEAGPFGAIYLIPTSIVLDRKGRVAARSDGVWQAGVLERIVDALAR